MKKYIFLLLNLHYLVADPVPVQVIELLELTGHETIYDAASLPGDLSEALKKIIGEENIVSSKTEARFPIGVSFHSPHPQQLLLDNLEAKLVEGGQGLIILAPLESEEQTILSLMKQTMEWREMLGESAPISIHEAKKQLHEKGMEIRHTEVRRFFKIFTTQEELFAWIIHQIAIPYGIDPAYYEPFTNDFISYLEPENNGKYCIHCKELVLYFICKN